MADAGPDAAPIRTRYLVRTGHAPCGCAEFYDAQRCTKVAQCEIDGGAPCATCTRTLAREED
jgi:hypothetical protein